MNDSTLKCSRSSLSTIRDTKLTEDVVDMAFYGRFADIQMPTNFFITLSSDNLMQNFQFPSSQVRSTHSLRESHGNFLGDLF